MKNFGSVSLTRTSIVDTAYLVINLIRLYPSVRGRLDDKHLSDTHLGDTRPFEDTRMADHGEAWRRRINIRRAWQFAAAIFYRFRHSELFAESRQFFIPRVHLATSCGVTHWDFSTKMRACGMRLW